MQNLDLGKYQPLIELARLEDLGRGDITSEITIPENKQGHAALVSRAPGVLCGMTVAREVLRCYDQRLELTEDLSDGSVIEPGMTLGIISGPLRSILAAERIVLNFIQRLSGIATTTARYVKEVHDTKAKICDTRKTTPGWRDLEKHAVRCGGGMNHRQGLWDAVLIKDNHLAALECDNLRQGLLEVLKRLKREAVPLEFIQVEVDTLEQLEVAMSVPGIDIILLDNMNCETMRRAVQMRDGICAGRTVLLEASGNVRLENVREIARTGVDRISIGALTHQIASLDIGLDLI